MFSDDDSAGSLPATQEGEQVDPPVPAPEETPAPDDPSKDVTKDDKKGKDDPEKKPDEKDPEKDPSKEGDDLDESGKKKKEDEKGKKEEKQLPFHKHPRFQKMSRDNRRLSKDVTELKDALKDIAPLIKKMDAKADGKDWEPEKTEPEAPDYEKVFDEEIDDLISTLERDNKELSPEDEVRLRRIADKYGSEIEDKKVPLRAEAAYKILQDIGGKEEEDEAIPKARKPGKTVEEGDVEKDIKQSMKGAKTTSQVMNLAKQLIKKHNL